MPEAYPITPSIRKVMITAFSGQVVEWYDYGLYGLLAAQIGRAFFPAMNPTSQLLSSFAVFGVAFLVRPLAGMTLGRLGDRHGRKQVLVLSLLIMTIATGLVGILPGADILGTLAPALLVLARIAQGASAAGESTSAITYVFETVPVHRRGFYGATLLSGNSAGFLLATASIWSMQSLFGTAAFDQWAWRIPFFLAIPLGLIGLFIRTKLPESPQFDRMKTLGVISATPLRDTFRSGFPQLVQSVGLGALSFVANYLLLAYFPIHLKALGVPALKISQLAFWTTIFLMICYPLMGALSDITGRKPLMIAACLLLAGTGWPLFAAIRADNVGSILLCAGVFALGTAAFIGVLGVLYNEFIAESRRMAAYSTGFNLSGAIFGGTSLWTFAALVAFTGDNRMPALYLVVAALISLLTLLTIKVGISPSRSE